MSARREIDYIRVIDDTRLELEQAGNPAFVVAILNGAGELHRSPMVFATIGPADDHARRLAAGAADGESVLIVNRSASATRAMFAVIEPKSLRKLHQRLEVIEEPLAESEGPI
jgi:hypothetical protein